MKPIFTLLLVITMVSCDKSSPEAFAPDICFPAGDPAWLGAIKQQYKDCSTCGVVLQYGVYENNPVIESKIITLKTGMVCDGVNIVYNIDGSVLFLSGTPEYNQYLQQVKHTQVTWTCNDSPAQ